VNVPVAILGNGVSGYSCAFQLAKRGITPLLIGPGPVVDRPPLSKQALTDGAPVLLATEDKLAEKGIDRLDGEVVAVDLELRQAHVRTAEGLRIVSAEHLVIALGLAYDVLPFDGAAETIVSATPAGARALAAELETPRDVIVVGGGLVGVETAVTLASTVHTVRILDIEQRPLHRLHEPIPSLAEGYLDELGVGFVGGVRIEEVRSVGERREVRTSTHGVLSTDVVVAATGGRPVRLLGLDGVAWPAEVDAGMRLPGHEKVYVIGDLAAPVHVRHGRLPMPHWDMAIRTGELAASTIAGESAVLDHPPYWWSEIGSHRLSEFGVAAEATSWSSEDGLHIGRDQHGDVVAVLLVDQPRRVREARTLLAGERHSVS